MPRTLLALHAHPDDESSKGAGTVARYAASGVRCVLVTATGGEAGDVLNPAMDRPGVKERLAELRRRELEAAAKIIGYHRVVELGYRDSGMPDSEHNGHPAAFVNVPFDEVLGRVVSLVREERPEVVIGYDEHVRYPHPDHIRVHDLSRAVFEAAADPDRFPDAGEPWAIRRLFAPTFTVRRLQHLHDAMLAAGLESPFDDRLKRHGDDPDPELGAQIDVSPWIEVARDALRAHETQVDPDGFWFKVPADVIRSVYPYEDFELMAARDDPQLPLDDLFAGL